MLILLKAIWLDYNRCQKNCEEVSDYEQVIRIWTGDEWIVIGIMNITIKSKFIGEMHLSIDLTEIYFRYEGGEGTVPQVI